MIIPKTLHFDKNVLIMIFLIWEIFIGWYYFFGVV